MRSIVEVEAEIVAAIKKAAPDSKRLIQLLAKSSELQQQSLSFLSRIPYLSHLDKEIGKLTDKQLLAIGHLVLAYCFLFNHKAVNQFIATVRYKGDTSGKNFFNSILVTQNDRGWTPLHFTVCHKPSEGFQYLIENVSDRTLWQSLWLKTKTGHTVDSFLNDESICSNKNPFLVALYKKFAKANNMLHFFDATQQENPPAISANLIREIAFTAYKECDDEEFLKAYLRHRIESGTFNEQDIKPLNNAELSMLIGPNEENILSYACWQGNEQVITRLVEELKHRKEQAKSKRGIYGALFTPKERTYFTILFSSTNNKNESALNFAVRHQNAQTLELLLDSVQGDQLKNILNRQRATRQRATSVFTSLEKRKDANKNSVRLVLLYRLIKDDELIKLIPELTIQLFLNNYEQFDLSPHKKQTNQILYALEEKRSDLSEEILGIINDLIPSENNSYYAAPGYTPDTPQDTQQEVSQLAL